MNEIYPYRLKGTKIYCPQCERKSCFTRYVCTDTNLFLSDEVGICDRKNSCGYHFSPKQYFASSSQPRPKFQKRIVEVVKPTAISYMKQSDMLESFSNYNQNQFTLFLAKLVGVEKAREIISEYNIGTVLKSGKNQYETIFWQVDIENSVRGGKVIQFDMTNEPKNHIGINCKRNKTKHTKKNGGQMPCNWKHSLSGIKLDNFVQCYYGVHLLKKYPDKIIAICESEKTAVLGSIYMPIYTWLACGGESGLIGRDCMKIPALKGRDVVLFPDLSKPIKGQLSCYDVWTSKMPLLRQYAKSVRIFNLTPLATAEELTKGFDIADFWLRGPIIP